MASVDQVRLSDGHVLVKPQSEVDGALTWTVYRSGSETSLGAVALISAAAAGSETPEWTRARVAFDISPDADANLVQAMGQAVRLVCQWAFAELSPVAISWIGPATSASRAVVHAAGFRIQPFPARNAWDGHEGPSDAWVADLVPEDTEPSDYRPLTAREHQVLALMAQGQSNQQIADSLGISENTAKNHVRAVLDALQAPSRTAAVVLAIRAGLVGISFDDAR